MSGTWLEFAVCVWILTKVSDSFLPNKTPMNHNKLIEFPFFFFLHSFSANEMVNLSFTGFNYPTNMKIMRVSVMRSHGNDQKMRLEYDKLIEFASFRIDEKSKEEKRKMHRNEVGVQLDACSSMFDIGHQINGKRKSFTVNLAILIT